MFKLENVKDLPTTLPAVIGSIIAVLAVYGVFTPEQSKTMATHVPVIILGIISIAGLFIKAEK